MVRCAIQGCANYQGKRAGEKIVRFFCFPKNAKLAQEWLHACGRGVKLNMSIARICSEHFCENDWKLQHVLLNIPQHKRKLKVGAVPSINIPGSQGPTKREERLRKREQKELVEEAISNYNRKYVMDISDHFAEPEVDPPRVVHKPGQADVAEQEDPLGAPCQEAEQLTKENKVLKRHMQRLKKRLHQAQTAISSMEEIFSVGQIKRIKNPCKKYKWSYEDILYASSLHSAGPTAYEELVKKNYPFPPSATLKKWAGTLKLKPGILTSIVNLLSNMPHEDIDRLCILSFHEIPLKPFNPEKSNEDEQNCRTAQVFIVRGLVSNWKYIIHYDFDRVVICMILKDIIHTLREIDYIVVAVVSGVGHLKLPLWTEMCVDKNRPYTEIFDNEKVFFFGNVPHLIKNFRNCFAETGFMVNGKSISVDPLKELLGPNMPDLQLKFKLTDAHLSAKKITKQNVELAWQLLTHYVADALKSCIEMGKISSENAIECSDIIQLFSDWLNVFNAKSTTEEEGSLAYGLDLEEQNEVISLMNDLMKHIKSPKCKTLLPFQKGILLNNASLVQLREYVFQKHKIHYVVTNRFNQDDLERSFNIRRTNAGNCGLPTVLEFKYKVNSSVLSTLNKYNKGV